MDSIVMGSEPYSSYILIKYILCKIKSISDKFIRTYSRYSLFMNLNTHQL